MSKYHSHFNLLDLKREGGIAIFGSTDDDVRYPDGRPVETTRDGTSVDTN
jgi:hypothetical protein